MVWKERGREGQRKGLGGGWRVRDITEGGLA